MKTTSKIWGAFLLGLAIWGLIAFVVITTATKNKTYMPYSTSDSIQSAKIDSVKGIYQQVIDSLARKKPKIITKIKWLKEADTIIYTGNDTTCIKIIERKDSLIVEQDSLIDVLDIEAQTYSDMVVLTENKLNLQRKRYETLIFKNDSVSKAVQDSLISELKVKKRSLFWQKIKTGVVGIAGVTAVIYTNFK